MSVVVRPPRPAEAEAVLGAQAAAFGDDGPVIRRLLAVLASSGALRAELVAVDPDDDQQVVGHVALSRAWLDAERALVEVLVLSPLGVHPAHQGRGVGGALVACAVARAGELGAPALFLEGDPGYYGPRGFVAAGPLGFDRPSERIPAPAFQVAVLGAHEEWMTGRLVYPEAFWALDCVGLRGEALTEVRRTLER